METTTAPTAEIVNTEAQESLLDPAESISQFGINGSLQELFDIGESRFGVFDLRELDSADDRKPFPDEPEVAFEGSVDFLIAKIDEDGSASAGRAVGLRDGSAVVLGKDHDANVFGYSDEEAVEGDHVELSIEGGELKIRDLSADNPRHSLSKEEFEKQYPNAYEAEKREVAVLEGLSFTERLRNAQGIALNELVRDPRNGGNELSEKYIRQQTKTRTFIVRSLRAGSLYEADSGEQFSTMLRQAHEISSSDDVYAEVGGGVQQFNREHFGEFRQDVQYGQLTSRNKLEEARRVRDIAEQYGDSYADRFKSSGVRDLKPLPLDGISEKYHPIDFYIKNSGRENSAYQYPNSEGIPEFMNRINEIGQQIQKVLESEAPDIEHGLDLIAQQYQLGVIIRPFQQINNSLFMNLANAQIKALGLHGISHGEHDFVGQRLETKAFQKYFKDQVEAAQ